MGAEQDVASKQDGVSAVDCTSSSKGIVKKGLQEMRKFNRDLQQKMNRADTWRLHEPGDDVLFARLLVASDFEVSRALQLLRSYLQWRHEDMVGGVPPSADWLQLGLASIPFEDKL